MPKISVIVPVYNTEKYLDRCIQSILAQTYTDFELLLIDDGSTDSSGAICDRYAEQDSRVRVFHKENGGVSSARNLGLDNAKGDWIGWVDSDDYIHPAMYFDLYGAAVKENADIVYCNYVDIDSRQEKKIEMPSSEKGKVEFINQYMKAPISALWVTLIKKNLYKEFNINFPVKNYYGEDFIVTSKLYLYSHKIIQVKKYLYVHCFREGESLMGSSSYEKQMMMIENLKEFKELVKEEDFYLSIKKNFASKILEAKAFLLYSQKDVMKWYYTETWTHKYILKNESVMYGKKRKLIEYSVSMCCCIIDKLLKIKI